MGSFACSCGKLMTTCDFWRQVGEAYRSPDRRGLELADFRTGFDVGSNGLSKRLRSGSLRWSWLERSRDRVLAVAWPGHRQEMVEVGSRTQALAEAVMQVTGSHIFVDASKERLRGRYLMRHVEMDVRIIHLVRDPRGVADSTLRHREGAGGSAEAAARSWVALQRRSQGVLDELPSDRWTRVFYEDLCANVEATMERLYAFCGADPGRRLAADYRSDQHLLGNVMRLDAVGEIKADERWRANCRWRSRRRCGGSPGRPTNVSARRCRPGGPADRDIRAGSGRCPAAPKARRRGRGRRRRRRPPASCRGPRDSPARRRPWPG